MMRLFVAIELPEDLKDELLSAQRKLSSGIAKISWVPKRKFHLTLKFLGEVDEGKVSDIMNRLGSVKFAKFRLCLDKIGFFQDSRKNSLRVIWVSVSPEKEVIAIQQKVDEALLDMFSSAQKFQSHITLGRVKSIKKPKDFMDLANKASVSPECFTVNCFKLCQSMKIGAGYRYTMLREFQLS